MTRRPSLYLPVYSNKRLTTLPQYLCDELVTWTGFEDVLLWTLNNGAIENDPAHKISGSQSIKLTNVTGGQGRFRLVTINPVWNMSAVPYRFRIYQYVWDIAQPHTGQTLNFWDQASLGFNCNLTFEPQVAGWNDYDVGPTWGGSWTEDGGQSWANRSRFVINTSCGAGDTAVTSFDLLCSPVNPVPACLFLFDDSDPSVYSLAFPYMRSKKVRGTHYIISEAVGDAGNHTLTQLKEMYGAGWDIANHSANHVNLTTLSQAEAQTEIETCKDYLITNNMPRAAAHLAYPDGAYNDTVIAAAQAAGALSGRVTFFDRGVILPPADWFKLRSLTVQATTTLAQAKTRIDNAKTQGNVVPLLFHEFIDGVPAGLQWAISDFRELVDYALEQRVIPLTVTDLYALNSGAKNVIRPW